MLKNKKEDNFSEWYSEVIQKADLADLRYNVQGFLVHKWDFLCKIVSASLQDLYLGPGIKDCMETYMCFSEIIPYIII